MEGKLGPSAPRRVTETAMRVGSCCRGCLLLLTFVLPAAASVRGEAPGGAGRDDRGLALFNGQIRALLTEKCLACHGPDQKKGGLDLTRRPAALAGGESGPVIAPGRPDES